MKPTQIFTRPSMQPIRRALRYNATSAEATPWNLLKNKQLEGRKFRRQHSIGNYVVDFYCAAEKLAVELDGAGHFTAMGLENDVVRDAFLSEQGVRVLRFENRLVFEEMECVLGEDSGGVWWRVKSLEDSRHLHPYPRRESGKYESYNPV